MNEALQIMGFLALFHVIGGVALGSSVRHWIRGRFGCNTLFSAVWGLVFGGVPVLIGLNQFASHGALLLVGVEVAIFLAAVLFTALVPDWFVESYSVPTVIPVAVGGLILLVGIVAGVTLGTSGEPFGAIIFFGAFSGLGGFVFVNGLYKLMKE